MPPRTRAAAGQPHREPAASSGANGHISITSPTEGPGPRGNGSASAGFRLPLPSLPNLGPIDAQRLLWFGGLGALATIGLLDWPIALVVGAGTVIAARSRTTTNPE